MHGLMWAGRIHKCERFILESEMDPCTNCLAYGHNRDRCSAKTRCWKCGGHHVAFTCSSTSSMCLSCSVEHPAGFSCQKRSTEKRDYRLAIRQQKPFWHVPGKSNGTHVAEPVNGARLHQETPATQIPVGEGVSQNAECSGEGETGGESTATGPDEQTESSDSEESSRAGSEHEGRHKEVENQSSVQTIAVATGPIEVDLGSTPLPEDTEAIIRQLERLKAIVLARNTAPAVPTYQIAGDKRKASEPLGPVSENSRPTTPKRVKQEVPAEDPIEVYIRENNCIPYPPRNR